MSFKDLNLPQKMTITDPRETSLIEMYRMMNRNLMDFSLNNLACFALFESRENHNQQKTFVYEITSNDPDNKPFSVKVTLEVLKDNRSGNLNIH